MKTYNKNGILLEKSYILTDEDYFAIQVDSVKEQTIIFYPKDNIIREIESELTELYDKFRDLYFPDTDFYYGELGCIPRGLILGGQSSESSTSKEDFIKMKRYFDASFENLNKHIYLGDCQYLISTIQSLLNSAEYCFVHFFIQIVQIDCLRYPCEKSDTIMVSSQECMDLIFLIEK